MKIAIEGCAHGDLDNIYDSITQLETSNGIKVDLLICCGDFQAVRNASDLACMAVKEKYLQMCSFYKYYTGEKEAPVLTIFVGGNHEASNYLQELPYGGWVAPRIYYLGYAGIINIAGIRIGGLSGIYKSNDFMKGHNEIVPYSENSKRSVYHIRNLEIFRLKQVTQPLDIFISHDWPSGVWEHGDKDLLLKRKPFLRNDVENDSLGSKPTEEVLKHLKPKYWFAAHLHCKFAAIIPHEDGTKTKFLSLDKCLPRRGFLQIIDIPHSEEDFSISYDLEWLTILHLTNHLLSVKNVNVYMPGPHGNERFEFKPTQEEKDFVSKKMDQLLVPDNFVRTAEGFDGGDFRSNLRQPLEANTNPQTVKLCDQLGIDDPIKLISELYGYTLSTKTFEDFKKFNSTPKLSGLKLPEPKNDSFEDLIERRERNEEQAEKIEPELIEESPSAEKKFKRRNASIYGSEQS